jgi:hypothetical protein
LAAVGTALALPGTADAVYVPSPGLYRAPVYDAASFDRVGRFLYRIARDDGRLALRTRFGSTTPPDTDGVPCSGDEPVCIVDVDFYRRDLPRARGWLVLRPEITSGRIDLFLADDFVLSSSLFGAGYAAEIYYGACYVPQPAPPVVSSFSLPDPNDCMGWSLTPPALSSPLLYH